MSRFWKRVFSYTSTELLFMLVTSFISGVLISFRKWGGETFDLNLGIENLVISTLFSFIALFIFVSGQKFYAVRKGFTHEYRINHYGLVIALFLAVFVDGILYFLAPGYVLFVQTDKPRVGKWRYRPYFHEYGYGVQHGLYVLLVVAALFAAIPHPLTFEFARICLLFAMFSLVPFPLWSGMQLFFASIYQYAFVCSFVIGFSVLLLFVGFWWALLLGLVLGVIAFFLGWRFAEKRGGMGGLFYD